VKPMTTSKVIEPFFIRKQVVTLEEKGKNIAQLKDRREFRCSWFQELRYYAHECPNKRIIVIKDDGEVE
jgi:hypothetical protein